MKSVFWDSWISSYEMIYFVYIFFADQINGILAGDQRPWAECWEIIIKKNEHPQHLFLVHICEQATRWVELAARWLMQSSKFHCWLAKIRVKGHSSRIRSLGRALPGLLNSRKITPWWDIFPYLKKLSFIVYKSKPGQVPGAAVWSWKYTVKRRKRGG